jgi:hypothetical protein
VTVVDSGKGSIRSPVAGEGAASAVSPLPRGGLCALALERDGGAEAAVDLRSSGRAPQPLPVGSDGGARVLDRIPKEIGQEWMSFAGIRAAQILADYWLWEALLNGGQEHINGIVELGTGKGGFSLYLAAQAHARGLFFRTYDVFPPDRKVPGFVQLDIYAHAEDIGRHLERQGPVILFCDGGNKPRELKTFSRNLSPLSLIVVHDWGTEMTRADVPENVVEVYGDTCDEIGSMSRCFRVAA